MQAYHLEKLETIDGIALREQKEPAPNPKEIIVRIRATSLNRRDTMILQKSYPLPAKPDVIPLSDGAGEVVAVGNEVTRFKVGDRVMGSYFVRWRDGRFTRDVVDQLGCTLDGMLTEYALLDEQWAVSVPEHLTWEEAATLPCAGVTAWNSVIDTGAVKPGQTVLTLGSGGVSVFAIQFAKLAGCRVLVTTSSESKAGKLREVGADYVINHATKPRWGEEVRDLGGADVIVETVGLETIEQSIVAAALHGQIILLITRSPHKRALEISGDLYAISLATIRRVFVGSRACLESMNQAIAANHLRPVIDRVFPFTQARQAYEYFLQGNVFGKVVILGA
jgi:NADPH:quinone reductase-like Zn-dependent oxidoreductase